MDIVSGIPVSDESDNFNLGFNESTDPSSDDDCPSIAEGFSSIDGDIEQNPEENILDSYFKLSKENNIALFYDRDHKHFIMVYNDNIRDDSRNIFVGYRNLGDVFAGQERNTIRICPRKQFERRIVNRRYIYSGSNPKILRAFLKFIKKNNLSECLSDISRNLNVLNKLYLPENEDKS